MAAMVNASNTYVSNASITKKSTGKAKSDKLASTLQAVQEQYEKASPEGKARLEAQMTISVPQKPDQMNEDGSEDEDGREDEREDLLAGGVKAEEQSLFVDNGASYDTTSQSGTIHNGTKDHSTSSNSSSQAIKPTAKNGPSRSAAAVGMSSPARVAGHQSDDILVADTASSDLVPEKLHGYVKGYGGHKFGIFQKGPRYSRKFAIRGPKDSSLPPDTQDLDIHPSDKTPITAVAGVAVYKPRNYHGNELKLLDPSRWGRRPPLTRIFVTRAGQAERMWVDRSTMRQHWPSGQQDVTVSESLEHEGFVVLKKGQVLRKADYDIARAAVISERKFTEWEDGSRPGHDKSPSPGVEA